MANTTQPLFATTPVIPGLTNAATPAPAAPAPLVDASQPAPAIALSGDALSAPTTLGDVSLKSSDVVTPEIIAGPAGAALALTDTSKPHNSPEVLGDGNKTINAELEPAKGSLAVMAKEIDEIRNDVKEIKNTIGNSNNHLNVSCNAPTIPSALVNDPVACPNCSPAAQLAV